MSETMTRTNTGPARTDAGKDALRIYGTELSSRMFLGTAQYPSPQVLERARRARAAG